MNTKKAFTLIEVLISLFISSFIMFSMMQLYRNLQSFIEKTSITMKFNREVYLLFSQMEKDFTTALIPILAKKEEQEKTPSKKEKEQHYFIGDVFTGEYKRVRGKRFELFKGVNFINTNPLFVHDQKLVRLVRVAYALQKNKQLSTRDRDVYDLYRKEASDLSNDQFKKSENSSKKEKTSYVKTYLIAKNLKHFSIEYQGFEKKEDAKKKAGNKKENKMIKTFTWGQSKETKNILPKKVIINISFWDNKFVSDYSFDNVIQLPVVPFKEKKDVKKQNKEKVRQGTKKTTPGKAVSGNDTK